MAGTNPEFEHITAHITADRMWFLLVNAYLKGYPQFGYQAAGFSPAAHLPDRIRIPGHWPQVLTDIVHLVPGRLRQA